MTTRQQRAKLVLDIRKHIKRMHIIGIENDIDDKTIKLFERILKVLEIKKYGLK